MELLTVEIKISSPFDVNAKVEQAEKQDDKDGDETMGLVLSAIARHGKEYNRSWVVKNFGPIEDFSTNPGALLRQVKELMGW